MRRARPFTMLAFSLLLIACNAQPASPRLGHSEATPTPTRTLSLEWVGAADGDGPLLVLLHGYGAPGDDLVPLGRTLRARVPGLRVALPAAPIDMGRGRAWWHIDLSERPSDRSDERPEGLPAARADLDALLERIGADPARTVVAGFSQGGMLATDLGVRRRPAVAGIASLSGGPIDADTWIELAPGGPPIFLSHGRQDPLLRFSAAERLERRLESAGVEVTWVPFDGRHEIPPAIVDGLVRFLNERL